MKRFGRLSPAFLIALAPLAILAHGRAWGAEDLEVEAHAVEGAGVAVSARATLDAPHEVIWKTLTDYDNLADFIPGMIRSRILRWRGKTPVIEQEGTAKILFFRYAINVTVESIQSYPDSIDIRLVKGNLKRLSGGYRIEKLPDHPERYVLRWSGVIEPDIALPQIISVPLMRVNISDQFSGMVAEIERRAQAQASGAPSAKGQ